jgi:glycosyltransferase involved in cell wall biosynthesis
MSGRSTNGKAVRGGGKSVLVIAPTPFFADRGCHVRIYEEVKLLEELGYHPVIGTYHNGRDIPGALTRRIPNIPWYRKLGAGPSYHKPYLDLLLFWTCVKLIREIRPSIIHGHLHEGALIGAILGRLFRIPCVGDFQGSLTQELADYSFAGRNRFVYRLLGAIEGWIDRLPEQVVVSSDALRDDLADRFRVPAERLTSVRDGVGQGFVEQRNPGSRQELGIPEARHVVVFMGVFTRLQGIEILMEAIPIVLDARNDVGFVVIGFPDEEAYAGRLARGGYRERVVFTGRMNYFNISRALALADLAVSPKISETEGNGKLFNYMACGLPTIVFESPVNREILGDSGIYVEKRTPEAFARAILDALAGGPEIRELGERLRARVLERSSWEMNREILAEVYERAIAKTYRYLHK